MLDLWYFLDISFLVSFNKDSGLETNAIFTPSSASFNAVALPMPLLPPVIIATLFYI